MIRDLRAECFALVCISHGRITRGANHSGGAGGDGESSLFQCEHSDLEAFAFFADQVFFRHAHVLQRKVSGVAGANAELAVNRSRSEASHGALDDEAGHAGVITLATLLFVSPAKEKEVISHIGETDPHLLAIQNVFVAFAPRRRARAHHIRARAGLSQSIRCELFSLCLRREIFLFLFFGSPGVKRQRTQAGVHRYCHPQKSIYGFKFFAHQAQRNVIEPRAAKLFGNANTEQVQLGHLVEYFAMKLLLLVPLFDVGRNFSLRELAHSQHKSFMVVGKLKVNHNYPQISQISLIWKRQIYVVPDNDFIIISVWLSYLCNLRNLWIATSSLPLSRHQECARAHPTASRKSRA